MVEGCWFGEDKAEVALKVYLLQLWSYYSIVHYAEKIVYLLARRLEKTLIYGRSWWYPYC